MKTAFFAVSIFFVLAELFPLKGIGQAPANDDICNAQLTVLDTIYPGDNSASTVQTGEPIGSCFGDGSLDNSVWFYFIASAPGIFRTSTDFAGATNTDTQLAAYSSSGGCSGTLSQIACDEDGGTIVNWNSVMDFTAFPGDTIWIQVDGWNGPPPAIGTFNIQTILLQPIQSLVNDDICNARLTVLDTIYLGHNINAGIETGEPIGTCFGDGSIENTVWYFFVAPQFGVYRTSTDFAGATNTDTQLAAYLSSGGCSGAFTQIACDEDGGTIINWNSVMEFTAFPGDTVWIQVDGWNGPPPTIGTFSIQTILLQPLQPLANDDICNALFTTLDSIYPGYNSNSSIQAGEPVGTCFGDGSIENTVWYFFVAPIYGVYRTSTDFASGTNINTQLAAYVSSSGCLGPLIQVGCDEDGGSIVNWNSVMDFTAFPGDTVWIQVDGRNGPPAMIGSFSIQTILLQPLVPPANDDIYNAQVMVLDTIYTGYNSIATINSGEPVGTCFGDGGIENTVWYIFTAPQYGVYRTSTDFPGATNTDTQLAAYHLSGGCFDSLEEIGCDEDGGTIINWNSIMDFSANAGENVWIQVDGWLGQQGIFNIQTILLQGAGQYDATLEYANVEATGLGAYSLIPPSQFSNGEVNFYLNVVNKGTDTVTAVSVNGNIAQGASNVTGGIPFIEGSGSGTVATNSFVAPSLSTFTASFSVNINEIDADPSNNISSLVFTTGSMSDTIMARENEMTSTASMGFTGTGRLANTYRFTNPDTISSITVFFGGDPTGKSFELFIADFNDGIGTNEIWNSGPITGIPGASFFTFSAGDFGLAPGLYLIGVNQTDVGVSIDIGLTTAVFRPPTSYLGSLGGFCRVESLGDPSFNGTLMIRPNVKGNTTTGISDFDLQRPSVKIFPNPNRGFVKIEFIDIAEASIRVFNYLGQLVYQREGVISSSHQFEIKAAAGVYILELKLANGMQKYKLVKE
jgi:Secretion system C-terminal sorting domain